MKLILGFLKPTQGTVTVGKKRVGKDVDFILLASHNMEDIRCLCDKVYEMDAGVLTPIDGVS